MLLLATTGELADHVANHAERRRGLIIVGLAVATTTSAGTEHGRDAVEQSTSVLAGGGGVHLLLTHGMVLHGLVFGDFGCFVLERVSAVQERERGTGRNHNHHTQQRLTFLPSLTLWLLRTESRLRCVLAHSRTTRNIFRCTSICSFRKAG